MRGGRTSRRVQSAAGKPSVRGGGACGRTDGGRRRELPQYGKADRGRGAGCDPDAGGGVGAQGSRGVCLSAGRCRAGRVCTGSRSGQHQHCHRHRTDNRVRYRREQGTGDRRLQGAERQLWQYRRYQEGGWHQGRAFFKDKRQDNDIDSNKIWKNHM